MKTFLTVNGPQNCRREANSKWFIWCLRGKIHFWNLIFWFLKRINTFLFKLQKNASLNRKIFMFKIQKYNNRRNIVKNSMKSINRDLTFFQFYFFFPDMNQKKYSRWKQKYQKDVLFGIVCYTVYIQMDIKITSQDYEEHNTNKKNENLKSKDSILFLYLIIGSFFECFKIQKR